MAGVRIVHPTARNVRFTVTDPNQPYDVPYQCTPPEFGGCGQVHLFKTHHLNLDDTGAAIVGDVLWEKAAAYFLANGFSVESEVLNPPTIGLGLAPPVAGKGAWGNIPIIHGPGNGSKKTTRRSSKKGT
jgi:hypothetical protein